MRLAFLAAAIALAAIVSAPSEPKAADESFRILVFSKTTGFRHASIEPGVEAVKRLGADNGFGVVATEDSAAFTPENLDAYAAVLFLNTTGNVLGDAERAALEAYVRGGGGYVGVHSAADTEYDSPFYEQLVGARFKSHPIQQIGGFVREDATHPATAHYPETFDVFDELYSFRTNPRERTHVLLSVDESTYAQDPNTTDLDGKPETGVMGDHPMSWCQDIGRGRSFYTALGHEPYLYLEDWYLRHLLGGIRTAAGRLEADCRTPAEIAAGPAPKLRLKARCLRDGRIRVRLIGGNARFKLGRRTVGDGSRTVLGRGAQGRRLRAVAGGRTVARVRLPRCGG